MHFHWSASSICLRYFLHYNEGRRRSGTNQPAQIPSETLVTESLRTEVTQEDLTPLRTPPTELVIAFRIFGPTSPTKTPVAGVGVAGEKIGGEVSSEGVAGEVAVAKSECAPMTLSAHEDPQFWVPVHITPALVVQLLIAHGALQVHCLQLVRPDHLSEGQVVGSKPGQVLASPAVWVHHSRTGAGGGLGCGLGLGGGWLVIEGDQVVPALASDHTPAVEVQLSRSRTSSK